MCACVGRGVFRMWMLQQVSTQGPSDRTKASTRALPRPPKLKKTHHAPDRDRPDDGPRARRRPREPRQRRPREDRRHQDDVAARRDAEEQRRAELLEGGEVLGGGVERRDLWVGEVGWGEGSCEDVCWGWTS
jgi:hypothetical protein